MKHSFRSIKDKHRQTKCFLVTGVSSGIGRALTKELIQDGYKVWGTARRKNLLINLKKELEDNDSFHFSVMDISVKRDWEDLVSQMQKQSYIPDVVIFNAAIFKTDLKEKPDLEITKEIFGINFFGIIEGVKCLLPVIKNNCQFLAISSLSSFRGSSIEGVGYPSSKAAISTAFESLYLKYHGKYTFKTLFLGPVATGMSPFKKQSFLVISEAHAVQAIIKSINNNKSLSYYPKLLFQIMKTIKLLPSDLYFKCLFLLEKQRNKLI